MFENLNVVLDLFLASAAVAIAIIQLRNEKRESERVEEEKRQDENKRLTIKEFVDGAEQIDAAYREFTELRQELRSPNDDSYQTVALKAEKCLYEYIHCIEDVRRLYTLLLHDEDCFPMSYGFARYIDAFRVFLQSDSRLRNACRLSTEFRDWVDDIYSEYRKLPSELINEYESRLNQTLQETDSLAEELVTLKPYIEEIKLKYSENSE